MNIIDINTGELTEDRAYDSDWLAIPSDLTLPAPLKKLAKEYETAWNAWSEQAATLENVTAELEEADGKDTLELINAVSKGEQNPGHPHREAAREQYRYQAEVTRQAAARSNQLRDQVWASVIDHQTELIADAARLERDAITRSVHKFTQARNLADEAEAEAHAIGSRINFLTNITNTVTSIGRRIEPYIPTVSWPEQWRIEQPNAAIFLDLITGEPTQAPTNTGWQISNLEQESEDA